MSRYLGIFIAMIISLGAVAQEINEVPIYTKYAELEKLYQSKSNDTTYVVNFWATWCGPCVQELPFFEQLQEEYKDDKLQVILVSLDFPRKMEQKLMPFLAKRKLKSKVVLLDDPKSNIWIDQVDPSWGGAIPVTLFIRNDKEFFWSDVYHSYDELKAHVEAMR